MPDERTPSTVDERPDPAAVVADADVLAADLLAGGLARGALDLIREHSWLRLVASEPLLDDGERVIGTLADETLAANWRARIEREVEMVDHPPGDHPALASAYRAGAAHVLTLEEELTSARTAVSLQTRLPVSVRTPEAFLAVFDPATLYEAVEGGTYPGPDRNPRR